MSRWVTCSLSSPGFCRKMGCWVIMLTWGISCSVYSGLGSNRIRKRRMSEVSVSTWGQPEGTNSTWPGPTR